MVVIKTVLRSGGEYRIQHVTRMKDMIQKYVKCPYQFVCYTDVSMPDSRPLIHSWQGWWSKIEIFKDVEESFYIDLDMTICGDITDMVTCKTDFMALRNMTPRIAGIGSAMMKWAGDYTHIYETFKSDPIRYMAAHGRDKMGTPWLGDQGLCFALSKCPFKGFHIDYFQDSFPNRISTFTSPQKTDIKVFYGKRKPWVLK